DAPDPQLGTTEPEVPVLPSIARLRIRPSVDAAADVLPRGAGDHRHGVDVVAPDQTVCIPRVLVHEAAQRAELLDHTVREAGVGPGECVAERGERGGIDEV